MYRAWGKRAFDLAVAVPALLLLAAPMALLALLVRLCLGSPVVFRQERPGRGGRLFPMLKFRTMTDARGPDGEPLPDAERLTLFGRALRATSLDELPELVNVVRGEMSLVGPRPLLVRYTPYFTGAERARFDVRPGITGWAQVNGRNDLRWDDRLARDIEYVRDLSFALDLRILLLTVRKVFIRDGLQVDPGASMLDLDEERRRKALAAGERAIGAGTGA